MKIACLGFGLEGQSVKNYFKSDEVTVFDHFSPADLAGFNLQSFDLVMRSPSVPPLGNWSSVTKYFFEKCPCLIIGVTGTKGKGTTATLIQALLDNLGFKTWLVGNVGLPALDVLDQINPEDIVIYELSSFQLWDLKQSPSLSVILRIEPDHLDIHPNFEDYYLAKANICRHQTVENSVIYYQENPISTKIANFSPGQKIAFPSGLIPESIFKSLNLPGKHNYQNAEAALLAVSQFLKQPIQQFLDQYYSNITDVFKNFHALPHRLEFIREYHSVLYYDDNYSSAFPALDVALAAFVNHPTILIAGGKDRGLDLTETKQRIFSAPNLVKAILIGETRHQLADGQDPTKYLLSDNLEIAVELARKLAESVAKPTLPAVVVMSPGAASFDMFKNFSERGAKFQSLVRELR